MIATAVKSKNKTSGKSTTRKKSKNKSSSKRNPTVALPKPAVKPAAVLPKPVVKPARPIAKKEEKQKTTPGKDQPVVTLPKPTEKPTSENKEKEAAPTAPDEKSIPASSASKAETSSPENQAEASENQDNTTESNLPTPATASGPAAQNSGGATGPMPVQQPTVKKVTKEKKSTKEPATDSKEKPPAQEGEAAPDAAVHTTPRTPQDDPNFRSLTRRAGNRAKKQKKTQTPASAVSGARAAAVPPANERMGQAQAKQVDTMNAQEAGEFNAQAFKLKLKKRIDKMLLPANEEQADNFEKHNNIAQIQSEASQDVKTEKDAAAGPVQTAKDAPPNVAAIPERKAAPMPAPPIGKRPAWISSEKGMPPPRGDAEVGEPLQQNMATVDQQMADNDITDEQLAKSNEPAFTGALEARKQARDHTGNASDEFRKQEEGILKDTHVKARAHGKDKLLGMYSERATILGQVGVQQSGTAGQDTAERKRIANDINTIYITTKLLVDITLNGLDKEVQEKFKKGSDAAKKKFEDHVDRKMLTYKIKRYGTFGGGVRFLWDLTAGLPDEVNAFFVSGRKEYIKHMDGVITEVAQLVATRLKAAKGFIAAGKQQVQIYINSQPEKLRNIAQQAGQDIEAKFDKLEEAVNSKKDALVDSLAQQYTDGLNAVDARIKEMKEANKGLVDKAMSALTGVIATIINIKNTLTKLLASATSVIGIIIADPIRFLGMLFKGIKQGFNNFGKNIWKHLQTGLITWLTGALGPVGITIPDDLFSLKGIFSLVAQILGISWDFIRAKAVKLLGEPAVQVIEKGVEIFMIIKEKGIAGLWEYIKEQFNDLKTTIIDGIKDMVITTVINAGIKWVLSLLNPASAFVKACMMIIDVVKFFIERGSQIVEMVSAFIAGVQAVASGSVGKVAVAIENALARAVPVIIGFLASLLGISGLANKVTNFIKKIRKRIDKAIDKLIIKVKKKFGALFKKGKAAVKKGKAALFKLFGRKTKFTAANGESHSIYYQDKGGKPVLMVASSPKSIKEFLNFYETQYNKHSEVKPIRAFITKNIDPLIKKLKTTSESEQIQQQLLEQNVELSKMLRDLLKGNEEVGQIIDSYLLEGLTGKYSSMPKPKADILTPDHQPQAAILEWSAKQKFFGSTSNMAKRASGRASKGYAINLYEKRHIEGRTFGSKGKTTKAEFIGKVKSKIKGLTTNQEKREVTVDLIKDELKEDVNVMNGIANTPNKNTAIWADIHALAISQKEKDQLITKIRKNIKQGEKQMLNQDLDSLKN